MLSSGQFPHVRSVALRLNSFISTGMVSTKGLSYYGYGLQIWRSGPAILPTNCHDQKP